MVTSTIVDALPDILPASEEVRTTDTFEYTVYETETEPVAEDTFTLSKAPVIRVETVTATVNNQSTKLTEGEDYIVSEDTYISILDTSKDIDPNTTISVEYVAESILSRFIETIEEQASAREENIDKAIASKFIDSANGNSLDEIGKLFGELGQRGNRDDEKYREYLSSIAEVYNGRGTKGSVAKAVAAVVSSDTNRIDPDSISYVEFFDENEYKIEFEKFEPHNLSLLYNVAEIADPSGINFIGPRYNTGSDSPIFTEGPKVDPSNFERYDTLDDVPSDFIDPIGPKETIRLEWDIFDDGVTSEQQPPWDYEWAHQKTSTVEGTDGGSWNQFQWSDGTWDSPQEVETEITGDRWEFADWNRVAPQAESPVPILDGSAINESVSVDITDTQ